MMEEQKVFVIECTIGHYDDMHTRIAGIFDNPEIANAIKDKLNAKAEEVKSNCPVDGSVFDLSEEDDATYISYYLKNQIFMDWEIAVVKEYVFNKEVELWNL